MSPWPHGDPRDVVHRVLADARYATVAPGPKQKTWLDIVGDALRDLWHRITDPLRHLTANGKVTTVVGIAVLAVVAVLLALVIVWFARGIRRRRARRVTPMPASALGVDSRTLFARALDAAAAGRHHEAAALLWASALRALDERGRVRFDPARTPGEWRRAVRDASFDAFARDAVDALFGDRGADAALVARMRDAYERILTPA